MEQIIQICYYVAIFSGGLLAILLLLSIIGGLDFDLDVDTGGADVDAGGLGIIKSGLTFLTFSAWVANIMLNSAVNPYLTLVVSLLVGAVTVILLSWVLRFFLKMQSDVNWEFHEAAGKTGKVYLKIPEEGTGLINVEINGIKRELKAKSAENQEISSGSEILVLDVLEEIAEVTLYK
jgi:membrane protein implicated in regulation of membrane protease activity